MSKIKNAVKKIEEVIKKNLSDDQKYYNDILQNKEFGKNNFKRFKAHITRRCDPKKTVKEFIQYALTEKQEVPKSLLVKGLGKYVLILNPKSEINKNNPETLNMINHLFHTYKICKYIQSKCNDQKDFDNSIYSLMVNYYEYFSNQKTIDLLFRISKTLDIQKVNHNYTDLYLHVFSNFDKAIIDMINISVEMRQLSADYYIKNDFKPPTDSKFPEVYENSDTIDDASEMIIADFILSNDKKLEGSEISISKHILKNRETLRYFLSMVFQNKKDFAITTDLMINKVKNQENPYVFELNEMVSTNGYQKLMTKHNLTNEEVFPSNENDTDENEFKDDFNDVSNESKDGIIATIALASGISIATLIGLIFAGRWAIKTTYDVIYNVGRWFKENKDMITANIIILENKARKMPEGTEKEKLLKTIEKQKVWEKNFSKYYRKMLGLNNIEDNTDENLGKFSKQYGPLIESNSNDDGDIEIS